MTSRNPFQRLALCVLAWLACGGAHAAADATLADCDAPDFQRVLAPAAAPLREARGYWLDRRTLQWPRAPRDGRYRLYHAADGRLVANAGQRVAGADAVLPLAGADNVPVALAERFRFVAPGMRLALRDADVARLPELLRGQLLLVREDPQGRVEDATYLQVPGALDDLHASAVAIKDLGATLLPDATRLRLWAPTARAVAVCAYETDAAEADVVAPLQRDDATGAWSTSLPRNLDGRYYTFLVDVFVPGTGMVRNRVTDPYAISLGADGKRGYLGTLSDAGLKPPGWDAAPRPAPLAAQTDLAIYELHVRDFSIGDASVPREHRGRYRAFTAADSAGMRHLRALAVAGITDVHLLPVYDFSTVPETGCITPEIPEAAPDSDAQQAVVAKQARSDCFNWGYDPQHYGAPEGSYASDATDGAVRIREFRAMVQALHAAGLRVGMDVVYNHTVAAGQDPRSVLDRIVPGYYHRLDAKGTVETSTCCANTATEHAMMAKLMSDTLVRWAREYRIDSFRFDLMGHQPRAAMEALQARLTAETGRHLPLIGEGWNFGEVADGARFVQASQRSLPGSGIATFSDRARDAVRGGGPGDHGRALVEDQGWINGLVYAPNAEADPKRPRADPLHAADLVRAGLAGTLRDYEIETADGTRGPLSQLDYKGQPAGYAAEPGEVVNYVENHDNQTLFDIDALKLPRGTSSAERARVQLLGAAVLTLSQGVAYFHAGIDVLRSKSLDRNSFDSGDWFNRLDWSYRDNFFGTGLPPAQDNREDWPLMRPLLADASIRPAPHDIAWMRDAFRDLLRIRASSTLFRLRSAEDVKQRLRFLGTGPSQSGTLVAAHIDGADYPGAGFREVLYFINVDIVAQSLSLPEQRDKAWRLHPVHLDRTAADKRPVHDSRFDRTSGRFVLPPRTALVYVIPE